MKSEFVEYDSCFTINMRPETPQDCAWLARLGLMRKALRGAGVNVRVDRKDGIVGCIDIHKSSRTGIYIDITPGG